VSTKSDRRAAARAEREQREQAERKAAERRRRLLQLGGALALAAVVVVVAAVLLGGGGESDGTPASGGAPSAAQSREVGAMFAGISQRGTVLGDPDAPATLTEFADLQCPFCAEYATAVLPTVIRDYVRPGRLKLDLQLMSFLGPDSVRAAKMAAAAGMQDRMWPFAELFYRNQGEENSGYVTDAYLRGIGSAVPGLDVERAMRDRDSPEAARAVEGVTRTAERAGVNSTPTFLVTRGDGEPQPLELQTLTPGEFTGKLDAALRG
jgi:protein-disulfide isomerase